MDEPSPQEGDEVMAAVGRVTPTAARLWIHVPRGVEVRVVSPEAGVDLRRSGDALRGTGGAAVVDLPLTGDQLTYRLLGPGGAVLAEGRVRRPDMRPDSEVVIGFASCHMPFDGQGRATDAAEALVDAARERCLEAGARYMVLLGDQLYADACGPLSLERPERVRALLGPGPGALGARPVEAIREAYHDQYRRFATPAWRRLLATVPTLPILDDHELLDNWGAEGAPGGGDDDRLARGARLAFEDFQALRVDAEACRGAEAYAWEADLGPAALFAFDIRTGRRPGAEQLLSDAQRERFDDFLTRARDKPFLVLGASVPPLHVPRWLNRWVSRLAPHLGGEFADRWSAGAFSADRDWILGRLERQLRQVPGQEIIVLSGDIHSSHLDRATWSSGAGRLHQFVSSPFTRSVPRWQALASWLSMKATRSIALADGGSITLEAVGEPGSRSTSRRNFGLLRLDGATGRAAVEILAEGEGGASPVARHVWSSPGPAAAAP